MDSILHNIRIARGGEIKNLAEMIHPFHIYNNSSHNHLFVFFVTEGSSLSFVDFPYTSLITQIQKGEEKNKYLQKWKGGPPQYYLEYLRNFYTQAAPISAYHLLHPLYSEKEF